MLNQNPRQTKQRLTDYPVDYFTREEKEFATEAEAVRAAEALRVSV
jgi:hypothetical protein